MILRTWQLLGLALVTGAQIAYGSIDTPNKSSEASATTSAAATKAVWRPTAKPTHRITEIGVPNFGKLNGNVWRSGQPTSDGYIALAKQGLKTVVNLREEYPQDKDLIPEGVKYVYIPITDQHAPTQEQAKQFMEVASDPENWPLLVHCHGGEGRAGVMSAVVRLSLDSWDSAKTFKETSNFRIKHLGLFSTPMPGCQTKFIREWQSAPPTKS